MDTNEREAIPKEKPEPQMNPPPLRYGARNPGPKDFQPWATIYNLSWRVRADSQG
jgi:hypothetical protein